MRANLHRAVAVLLLCVWILSGSEPVLLVVVNRANTVETLTRNQLRNLLLGENRQWPNRQPVVVVQRDQDSPVFKRVLHVVLRMTPSEYKRRLLAAEFRGEDAPRIKTLNSNEGAAKFVFNVPGAIAVVDDPLPRELDEQLKILRIDGKRPGDPDYDLK